MFYNFKIYYLRISTNFLRSIPHTCMHDFFLCVLSRLQVNSLTCWSPPLASYEYNTITLCPNILIFAAGYMCPLAILDNMHSTWLQVRSLAIECSSAQQVGSFIIVFFPLTKGIGTYGIKIFKHLGFTINIILLSASTSMARVPYRLIIDFIRR